MLRKWAKTLLILPDSLFCAFLGIYILKDCHRPFDLAARVPKRRRAYADPSLTSVVRAL
jgi:hypothetical protein